MKLVAVFAIIHALGVAGQYNYNNQYGYGNQAAAYNAPPVATYNAPPYVDPECPIEKERLRRAAMDARAFERRQPVQPQIGSSLVFNPGWRRQLREAANELRADPEVGRQFTVKRGLQEALVYPTWESAGQGVKTNKTAKGPAVAPAALPTPQSLYPFGVLASRETADAIAAWSAQNAQGAASPTVPPVEGALPVANGIYSEKDQRIGRNMIRSIPSPSTFQPVLGRGGKTGLLPMPAARRAARTIRNSEEEQAAEVRAAEEEGDAAVAAFEDALPVTFVLADDPLLPGADMAIVASPTAADIAGAEITEGKASVAGPGEGIKRTFLRTIDKRKAIQIVPS